MFPSLKSRLPSALRRVWKCVPWIVLLLGLASTCWLSRVLYLNAQHSHLHDFQIKAGNLVDQLEKRLETQMLILRGAAGFFTRDQLVTKQEFEAYMKGLRLENVNPGVLAVGFALAVPRTEKDRHLAVWRKTLGRDYRIWPNSPQELVTSIIYLKQLPAPRPRNTIGYDMYADPTRRAAMNIARDLHRPVVTGRLQLQGSTADDVRLGFHILFPVYQGGAPIETLFERRRHIRGWVFSPILADTFVEDLLNTYGSDLQMVLYTASDRSPSSRLTSGATAQANDPALVFSRSIDVAGQPWLVQINALPSFKNQIDLTATTTAALAGGLLSLTLFAYLWALTRTRERAETMANDMTQALRRSEHRWQFAIEGHGDGLWDWNLQDNKVFFSRRWKAMLGHADDEIGDDLQEWESRLHPEDRQRVLEAADQFILGKTALLDVDLRMRCKDGSWKWVNSRGFAVERASDGHALRAISTQRDITQDKQAEERISRLNRFYLALSRTNQAIVRCRTQHELFAEVCRIVVQYGGMKMAWIGLLDRQGKTIYTATSFGMPPDYLAGMQIPLVNDEFLGAQNFYKVISENRPVWCQDVLAEPALASFHARANEEQWRAIGVLPLLRMRLITGVLQVYSAETSPFDEEVRRVLEGIAEDVSSALDNLEREADRLRMERALQDSERRYSTLFAESAVSLLVLDPDDGKIVDANMQACRYYGWDLATLRLMNIRDINALPPEQITPEMLLALRHGKSHFHFRHRLANGSIRDVEVFTGPILVQNKTYLLSAVHDISDQRRFEQALQDSELLNSAILNSLDQQIALLDANGVILNVNQAWLRFAGSDGPGMDDWVGVNYLDICATDLADPQDGDASWAAEGIRNVLNGNTPSFEREYLRPAAEGPRWFLMRVHRLTEPGQGAVVMHEDITSRKLAEVQRQISYTRLEEMTAELIEAQERERKNLARELHDELGQKFTTLKLGLHHLRPMLSGDRANDAWHVMNEEILKLVERVRSMSGSLRPPALDHLGLEASLRQLIEENLGTNGVTCVFEYAGLPARMPAQTEIAVYRIVQEAVTNIMRHAGANHTVIEINGGEKGDEIELIIRDNGRGFDVVEIATGRSRISYGLTGMQERVKLLGGTIELVSEPGKGTRITVVLPLAK